ncbi:CmpA/NrtA family ABC transporter substrate-binding protein [Candidatus Thiothrix sp. Deng01]|uniref:CmpA/NrtA family ABC transporter substrate-binding protein n=1 Tax=Candidatus Thiothrix phosphatis TaxID=3112415 RepID=A0ABU6D1E2_9GAMM|nr:CmpA/NrtA family ABC transporter substrate-binding protein [Candidatus Thiothrix sp. Deng01]MEB4592478.1 CmpA/NrtA family ABC transporter substrate-binding protein [Candidatus Thiothrix sp. Deng01]
MKQDLRIGFLPLTDCAVLVAAQERGFFEKYGLNVTLQREVSWANIRDRVAFGELDAAHMLAPMPLAATLGIDGLGIPMQTAVSIGLNGSAITLSSALMQGVRTHFPEYLHTSPLRATGLKALLGRGPQRKLVLGCVYPFSQHYYLLRAWLQDGGLEIGQDVEVRVIPPSQMVSALTAGEIDGYCAGEPWNQAAVQRGVGCVAVSSYGLWHNGPEKVVGVTQAWAEANPQLHLALVKALLEAAVWADDRHNRAKLAEMLACPQYLDVPLELIRAPLLGRYRYAADEPERFLPDFNVFARYAANFPWRSHGRYFLRQMLAAGQLAEPVADENALLASVYRTELYRQAADALGYPYPTGDEIPMLDCTTPWVLHEASQPIAMGSNHIALPQLRGG